ncbi:DUF7448 domain-containing protein [Prescottella equi]|uniref:DUF7448 domain-containing protein n=1 Tax=Rhodococcus hoagii TaxID=43767 RepID=UPI001EEBD065|nr:hypothetical protein [Prescottella equi]
MTAVPENHPYPPDSVDNHPDRWTEDNGTMPENVDQLADAVVGHRIVSAEQCEVEGRFWGRATALVLTLDDGTQVQLADTDDCCAFTSLEKFLLHPERVDHIITGVATTDGYTRWHIFADMGDVLELEVGWSAGNPFYYMYGFNITVVPVEESS